ncbi:MAG: hypothetical protein ABL921_08985 [Pirellula sp.]
MLRKDDEKEVMIAELIAEARKLSTIRLLKELTGIQQEKAFKLLGKAFAFIEQRYVIEF